MYTLKINVHVHSKDKRTFWPTSVDKLVYML